MESDDSNTLTSKVQSPIPVTGKARVHRHKPLKCPLGGGLFPLFCGHLSTCWTLCPGKVLSVCCLSDFSWVMGSGSVSTVQLRRGRL